MDGAGRRQRHVPRARAGSKSRGLGHVPPPRRQHKRRARNPDERLTSGAAMTVQQQTCRERRAGSGTLADLLFPLLGRGWSKTAIVELRGRLSNPEAAEAVAMANHAVGGSPVDGASNSSSPRESRPWRLVDRLGDQGDHGKQRVQQRGDRWVTAIAVGLNRLSRVACLSVQRSVPVARKS